MVEVEKIIRVVAAIIEHEGKYLVCRRAQHKASPGEWEFPGGKIEPGETPQIALAREILEELGIPIVVGEHFDTSQTPTKAGIIQLECYLATGQQVPAASTDHDLIELAEPGLLPAYQWARPDLPAVNKLASIRQP